tara:strand:+ start:555 stop:737 length:183 start_codon:yes stop_codon:yes gene_type:complete
MVKLLEEGQVHDQKVFSQGGSRALTVGRFLPKDWEYVRITPLVVENGRIVIAIENNEAWL